jgi:hypothetical protein
MLNIDTRTADKKRPIPLFVEQSHFEQFTPTRNEVLFSFNYGTSLAVFFI